MRRLEFSRRWTRVSTHCQLLFKNFAVTVKLCSWIVPCLFYSLKNRDLHLLKSLSPNSLLRIMNSKTLTKLVLIFVVGISTAFAESSLTLRAAESSLTLQYDEPAKEWTDALPVGNGSTGGMVFGGVEKDRIQFNHDTLWAGQSHSYSRKGGVKVSGGNSPTPFRREARRSPRAWYEGVYE